MEQGDIGGITFLTEFFSMKIFFINSMLISFLNIAEKKSLEMVWPIPWSR